MDTRLISRMQSIINTSFSDDTNKNIATYILKNLQKIDTMSISGLAVATFTSTASISRFARNIGCENFNDMKVRLRNSGDNSVLLKYSLGTMDFSSSQPFEDYINEISNSLLVMKSLPMADLDYLVRAIHDANDVYFFGVSIPSLLAQNAQATFLQMGKFIHTYETTVLQEEAATVCPQDSLAIIFSMDGNFMSTGKKVEDSLVKRNIRQILVTQNPTHMTTTQYSKVISIGKPSSTIAGRYKVQLFFEMLMNRYADLYIFKK